MATPDRDYPDEPAPVTAAPAGFLAVVIGVIAGGFLALAALILGLPGWAAATAFALPLVLATLLVRRSLPRLWIALKQLGPSPERRAARRRATAAQTVAVPAADDGWPTVPELPHAPGVGRTLPVLLPAQSEASCCVLAFLIPFSAVWVGGISFLFREVVRGHLAGRPNWFMTLFSIPFLLGTLILVGLIVFIAYKLLAGRLVGPITLEISHHPLTPGTRARLRAEQPGGLTLRQVTVALVCEESASYHQGTSTRTETKEVYRQDLPGDAPGPADSLAAGLDREFTVPADAMHSFGATNNKVSWRIEVTGRGGGSVPWTARFPVIVRPADPEPRP